jgi:hypothetical protein
MNWASLLHFCRVPGAPLKPFFGLSGREFFRHFRCEASHNPIAADDGVEGIVLIQPGIDLKPDSKGLRLRTKLRCKGDFSPCEPTSYRSGAGPRRYKIYNGYWFFGRPTLEDLRQDLRAITRKIRPDWDIVTPELKAAWKEGRKELFYPYGKTYAQTLGEQD